ncbi:MAG: septum site-determining protein MinC [Paenibacillus dendritiformis]|uniref:septum site-determining protein MinC n=1 Tax=Paenibacillus dendritiformis TaxID=130049 RepID=UPI00143CD035|nr:septum site-determining protein MinC [Paenibacillus dendritiformis]MDU5144824.1 septum site-determining protein MinC [Paenibacillus dendritiformis]NKI23857.1 septum site-determining protein MinC [Paenibacillus dendritiformis]NRF97066.1 septum site-determining protein MinC [Paenibacillus dendritiformis]GIO72130.1 putative septum site-determining protein MinC [Paenibacillus dendritiformis]
MTAKPLVTIKGMKDGLVFLLDDQCEFTDLLQELRDKLDHTPHFFDGPLVYVDVKLGARTAADEQKTEMLNILRQRGNLLIRSLESDADVKKEAQGYRVHSMTGMVRSGQVLRHDGHLLFLGDVNPGGMIISSGDIFVFGALRGTAHAGVDGETGSVIAASLFAPTQLRIADVISRPPDEWGVSQAHMEFAYIHDGMMQIDKISQLHRVRKDITLFKGV